MTGLAVMAVMAGVAAHGAGHGESAAVAGDRAVTVCMAADGMLNGAALARMRASEIFRGIGVRIDWRRTLACPGSGIVISLSYRTPAHLMPGALAYAKPYEGTHIVLFYDRIAEMYERSWTVTVLSHVLVHEVSHILEGVSRHSDSGVMKARWTGNDFAQMRRGPLGFAQMDVELIHDGLDARARQAAASGAASVAPGATN